MGEAVCCFGKEVPAMEFSRGNETKVFGDRVEIMMERGVGEDCCEDGAGFGGPGGVAHLMVRGGEGGETKRR